MPKIDLNAPAFGTGAQKVSEVTEAEETDKPAGDAEVEQPKEPEKKETDTEASEEEPSKVPYSRFKKFHDLAKEAQEEAEYWRQEAQRRQDEYQPRREEAIGDDEVPAYWKKLYGDESSEKWPLVKEAWKIQAQANAEFREQARREALDAVRGEREHEAERVEANLETLDAGFEDLEAFVGRQLTEREQSAVLDIVDKYTPKDKYGNYAGAIMQFEDAWDIYEMQQNAAKAPKQQKRDSVAGLTNGKTAGENTTAETDKQFNPLDWNAWKKRI